MEKFQIDSDRLFRVSEAIARGDGNLEDCLAPDIKHMANILAHLCILQELAPGFLDEVFETMIPHFIKRHNEAAFLQAGEKFAEKNGVTNEFRALVEAKRAPNQKDLHEKAIALHMKLHGLTQAEAIRDMAKQIGRNDENVLLVEQSVRRAVNRSKARKK